MHGHHNQKYYSYSTLSVNGSLLLNALNAGTLSLEDWSPHLKTEAAYSSATPVKFYHTMWYHITQSGDLQSSTSEPQIPHPDPWLMGTSGEVLGYIF